LSTDVAVEHAMARIAALILALSHNPDDPASLSELDALTAALPLFPPEPLRHAARTAAVQIENCPHEVLQLVLRLLGSDEPATRALAAGMIARFAQFQPAVWKDVARMLITDPVWEVRMTASAIFDSVQSGEGAAEFHTEFVFGLVQDWTRDQDYLIRHAATQALLRWAGVHLEESARLLALLEPLFNDPIDYVRAGTVLALRTLGRKRPPLVLSYIELRLDNLGDYERDTYQSALDDRFANAHADWKARLLAGLANAPSVPPANIE
jgi:hypothetical protein